MVWGAAVLDKQMWVWRLQGKIGCMKYPNVRAIGFSVGAAVLDRLHKI